MVGLLTPLLWQAAEADDAAPNLTGLPTYPKLSSAIMMGDPHACSFYNARSTDSMKAVVAWYRAHLPGQTPVMTNSPINGPRADFGVHAGTQVIVFVPAAPKNAMTSIVLGRGCPKGVLPQGL
jgi:hypothetical protein